MDKVQLFSYLVSIALLCNLIMIVVIVVVIRHFVTRGKLKSENKASSVKGSTYHSAIDDDTLSPTETSPLLSADAYPISNFRNRTKVQSVSKEIINPKTDGEKYAPNIKVSRDSNASKRIHSIQIGDIVIVIQPFHGKTEDEFPALETGDLLIIEDFLVKGNDSIKQCHLKLSKGCNCRGLMTPPASTTSSDSSLKSVDYCFTTLSQELWCKALLLGVYLDFSPESGILRRRRRQAGKSQSSGSCIKELPYSCIALESDVLKEYNLSKLASGPGFGR